MTQITLAAPRITSGAPSGRWLKSLSRHAGRMLAFLACLHRPTVWKSTRRLTTAGSATSRPGSGSTSTRAKYGNG